MFLLQCDFDSSHWEVRPGPSPWIWGEVIKTAWASSWFSWETCSWNWATMPWGSPPKLRRGPHGEEPIDSINFTAVCKWVIFKVNYPASSNLPSWHFMEWKWAVPTEPCPSYRLSKINDGGCLKPLKFGHSFKQQQVTGIAACVCHAGRWCHSAWPITILFQRLSCIGLK